ncbi:hypothetical protein CGZ91_05650 [Parenemella sanctibonifatiensis]|uniref:ATP/GTP-binding protein n=1 Tax=Parenemella sanctibonifatiensis TaxID=2016505 RepID=A0A255ENC6_9ACTN|nr:hypothetical protein CGZ92_09705 [Parenemella sanctibonifatiensis]OYN90962.1 hypothetical protein CGZ91_05650 [Parenemella sanctibonifatiensis]
MVRRRNKYAQQPRPLSTHWAEGRSTSEWIVRANAGNDKSYTCPGCRRLIEPGEAHLVVWPRQPQWGEPAGVRSRKHWHEGCWRTP